jgi:hypothetical protein
MYLPREWKAPRFLKALLVLEFCVTVAGLALFGIAAPNLFRTALWKDGAHNGFNSDLTLILYAHANHRTPPKIPLVWSQL